MPEFALAAGSKTFLQTDRITLPKDAMLNFATKDENLRSEFKWTSKFNNNNNKKDTFHRLIKGVSQGQMSTV